MFAHLTLHRLAAKEVVDHPWDPFNHKAELYQTWQIAALEPLEVAANEARWARQGFSVRGAPTDAPSFGDGEARTVVDPQIALGLPDLRAGEKRAYRFDVHYWESDGATEKVRAVFSDATLAYMAKAWKVAKEDEQKALSNLGDWFDDNWEDIASGLLSAAAPAAAGVLASYNLLPLLELLFRYVRSDGDDYHQMHRFVVQLKGTGNGPKWQITSPSTGESGWLDAPGKHSIVERVASPSNGTRYDVNWIFRMVD